MALDRITFDEKILGGRACIRGMRIPVSVVLKLMAGGMTQQQILADYPDLEQQDIAQCVEYAALLADETVLTEVECSPLTKSMPSCRMCCRDARTGSTAVRS